MFARRCEQGLRVGRIGQIMRLDRDSGASRPEGWDFELGSAMNCEWKISSEANESGQLLLTARVAERNKL